MINSSAPKDLVAEAHRAIEVLSYDDPLPGDRAYAISVIYKLIADHQGPLGYDTWKDAAVAEKVKRVNAERDLDMSFTALHINGVPPQRAKTVANGIDVLVTRMARDDMALREQIAELKAQLG